ncbi:MAG: excisionase family DNA-binding protein [bacterium]|nr:excisionase family DNA-binding protein [bacterium]
MDLTKKEFFSVAELAKNLNVSRQSVFKKIKNGQIKAEKIGRNYIIAKDQLQGVMYDELTEKLKQEIEKGVVKVVKEYGEVLKLLGKE